MNGTDAWETTRSPAKTIAALVIADHEAPDAAAAIGAAPARLVARVDWAAAPTRLEAQGPVHLIAADCEGTDDGALAEALPRINQFARDNDARLVATLASTQVDLVAANLFGPNVELLCAPSLAERVAAYAPSLSQSHPDRLFDSAREVETTRLRRLNEEIARIAETLARLSRVEGTDSPRDRVADRGGSYTAQPPSDEPPPISPREVRGAIRARRLRDQYFTVGLFEDPAWDILLDLFAAELERVQVSVSSLCIATAVAPTTALRWIAKMTEAGLLTRVPDPFDRRRAFMELAPSASEAMRGYLGGLKRAGLAIL
ncbi:MarR family winged helix-turn-helix transcriptional regulator [Sphingomonas sp. H39-1-10]|uniref:MarR family winged helix-turn-helix transcriptional regulator n=1 Tax=Sphingomonas pollutisoli TaxID=3030829 RepID=UPI0023B9415F|nr:MarR family winged helix-turn-helix transcriptional regulator [Sphingomonas pollutisoli]MDF0487583.1 MarR family winged helix-turn-helix transcriptional regulator [Sphingomonas pollutisoli]